METSAAIRRLIDGAAQARTIETAPASASASAFFYGLRKLRKRLLASLAEFVVKQVFLEFLPVIPECERV